jgi:uncharacterized protein
MVINVAQISEDEGLTIDHVYPAGEPRLGDGETRLVSPLGLRVRVTREGSRVDLSGSIDSTVEFDCDRCLKPVHMPVRQSFDLAYVPPLTTGDEKALGESDLDIGFYRGDVIDLDDVVREQVELTLPMSRRCGEQCKGLCPECGARLNERTCECRAEEIDPRWATLKDFNIE